MRAARKRGVAAEPSGSLEDLRGELAKLGDEERARNLRWFFKTGKGEYGEGDDFLGIRVPEQRRVAKRFWRLSLPDVARLLRSPIHEHRFVAAKILVEKYERGSAQEQDAVVEFYFRHARRFNNWDLVDTSAPYIVGEHLHGGSREPLFRLVKSDNLWERRIAIVATLRFIKHGDIEDTFRIAELLLGDKHDLIHKAVGWALREAGRISRPRLVAFLREHYRLLPRTALRYAIEHFPEAQRRQILAGRL